MNLKKIRVELRVCIVCKHIWGCHLFGQEMKCEDCFIHQCELRKAKIDGREFFNLLESRKISVSGGICDFCWRKRELSRQLPAQQKGGMR